MNDFIILAHENELMSKINLIETFNTEILWHLIILILGWSF